MTCRMLTLEEYAALPEDDCYRDELSRGLLVREPRPAYQEAGTPLVWVVDPRRRTVRVHPRGGGARLLTEGDVLTGAPVLPGLRVPVRDLFVI